MARLMSRGYRFPDNLAAEIGIRLPLNNDQIDGINYLITNVLTEKEQEFVLMYYGKSMTLREVGDSQGVSFERARQVIIKAKWRMKLPGNIEYIIHGYAGNMKRLADEAEERAKTVQNAIERIRNAHKLLDSDVSIKYLHMENRVYNALLRANVKSIGQLANLDSRELYKIRGLGSKGVYNVKKALKDMEV